MTGSQINTEEGKSWTLGLLRDENVKDLRITFTKVDGTERVLHCTLAESRIPTEKRPAGENATSYSSSAIRVFDIEKQDWRAFRWDSVKRIEFSL